MKTKIIIIGAGIVGLATAVKLLEKNKDFQVTILEKEDDIAKHQTGNNSGVIHSGIYYKPGSLKAKNCKKGYDELLKFCDEHKIKYNLCGKVIVATNDKEIPALEEIFNRGNQNGLDGLKIINREELLKIEPYVNGIKGIFVPQTGIINYTEVCKKYKEVITSKNGNIVFNTEVKNIKINEKQVNVITGSQEYESDFVISCAGLHSDIVAKMTNPDLPVRIIPFRGEYYELVEDAKSKVKTLIYPVPDPAFPFLGVHFTNMISGGVEAGPNAVFAFKREGYTRTSFSIKDTISSLSWKGFRKVMYKYWKTGFGEMYRSFSKKAFVKALQKLIPEIESKDLKPGGAGVRAQACHIDGKLVDDFYIVENERVLHVCNAPSPAATASLAIGDEIAEKVVNKLK